MTVNALIVRDTVSGETSELPVQGMFVAIGYKPNTELFEGQLKVGAGGISRSSVRPDRDRGRLRRR